MEDADDYAGDETVIKFIYVLTVKMVNKAVKTRHRKE